MLDEKSLELKIVTWFKGISDGGWGAAPLKMLVKALDVAWNEQVLAEALLHKMLSDPIWRRRMASKNNIDVKITEIDGQIARVRLRSIPKKSNRKRDERLPPLGTPITTLYQDVNGDELLVAVNELPNGTFMTHVEGKHLGIFKTISEAARVAVTHITGERPKNISGYRFFNLGRKLPKGSPPNLETDFSDTINNLIENALEPVPKPISQEPETQEPTYFVYDDIEWGYTSEVGYGSWDDTGYNPDSEVLPHFVKDAFTIYPPQVKDRPSYQWGVTVRQMPNGKWSASAIGLEVIGDTPEKALLEWDRVFVQG